MEKWISYKNARTYAPPRYTLRKRLALFLGKSDFERWSHVVPLAAFWVSVGYAGKTQNWGMLKYSLICGCIAGMLGYFDVFRRTTDEAPTAEGAHLVDLAFWHRRGIFAPKVLCPAKITFWQKLGQKVDQGARWLSEKLDR